MAEREMLSCSLTKILNDKIKYNIYFLFTNNVLLTPPLSLKKKKKKNVSGMYVCLDLDDVGFR